MSKGYSEFFDEINKKILEVSASEEIDDQERQEIINALSDLLRVNIHQSQMDSNIDYLSESISLHHVDAQLHDIYISTNAGADEYKSALKLCERQKKLLDEFRAAGWKLPALYFSDIDTYTKYFEDKYDNTSLNEKINYLYFEANTFVEEAGNTLDLEKCESALILLNKLDQIIEKSQENKNIICNFSKTEIEEKRQAVLRAKELGEERKDLYDEIKELDSQIIYLDSNYDIESDKWGEILSLCNRLDKLSARCVQKGWNEFSSSVDTHSMCAKYEYYQEISSIDKWISAHRNNLMNEDDYGDFINKCSVQAKNLKIFVDSGWRVPGLINPNPDLLRRNAIQGLYDFKNKIIRRKKLVKCGLAVCIFLIFCILGMFIFLIDRKPFPFDNESIIGMDYKEVEKTLTDTGFTNITCIESSEGWLKDNSVLSVTVNGNDTVKERSQQKEDAEIIIEFSSNGRVNLTDLLKDWNNNNYHNLEEEIKEAGVINIKTEPEDTFEEKEDGIAIKISFGGQSFNDGECFVPKEMPVEIIYGVYKIPISYSTSELLGKNYGEVVEELQKQGFNNIESKETNEGWAESNTIVEIDIDGNSDFKRDTAFIPDSKVSITYSSSNRVEITDNLKNIQEKKFDELTNLLRKKGLGNVKIQKTDTFDIGKNKKVSQVFIGNKKYTGGSCFVRKSENIRIEYYYLRIRAEDDFDFENKNYQDYAAFLTEKGFSDITLKRSDDLVNGWLNKEGIVRKVLVDGEDFKTGEVYNYDARIEIIVNTFKKKGCEDITEVAD